MEQVHEVKKLKAGRSVSLWLLKHDDKIFYFFKISGFSQMNRLFSWADNQIAQVKDDGKVRKTHP